MARTIEIHGVTFPIDSTDGLPDLPSVKTLINGLESDARSCNGFALNGQGTKFCFDRGWGSAAHVEEFVKRVARLAPFVSDIEVVDEGRAAWGCTRYTVTLKTHTQFCFENAFVKGSDGKYHLVEAA